MTDATVKLKPGKDGPARAGHPWIFSGAIAEIDGEARGGAFVRVLSASGQVLGTGTYNPRGSIAVRLLAREDVTLDASFVRRRVADAYALRESLGIVRDSTAYRLLHGEGDWLPGVVADVYGGFVVVQILTAGAERLRPAILAALQEVVDPEGIFERSSGGARREEGLGDRSDVAQGAAPPERIEVNEGGARYLVDVRGGQKTGFYVDQRDNRALVGRLARERDVLNCFAYTGGFAIAAGRGGARRVVSVETSGPALQLARDNWALNGLDESRAEWLARDVFDVLTPLADAPAEQRFDLVILDPPPFARHRADRDKAVRAYRDVNRRALRALRPGGLLATFTCSAHVSRELFLHAVATAAQPTMRLQVLAQLGAPADHPVLAAHPEGEYLSGLLIRAAAG
ncbi:class I SAM-dependent rRNA methyltransferase [Candidatus Binatia bacterium]|nr:class I SAM-dependent rRNA methyltransferase [Candidatus Binatia bacterium]